MPVTISALNSIQGPGPQIQEIGPQYDLLLATRDGSVLPCKNKDGDVVNVSKLAYMTTIDRQQVQHEETELQHKDQLVQLAGPSLIDREFDQWPQVSQGDWSGGVGQRVFTGATPISGGTESDPTRYWDGIGLLWPLTDYLPVRAVRATPDQHENAPMKTIGVGTVSGSQTFTNTVFVYMYQQTTGAKNNIMVIAGDAGSAPTVITNPGGIPAGSFAFLVDYIIALGMVVYIYTSGANMILATITSAGVLTNQVTFANATTLPQNGVGALAAAFVGDKQYVAVGWLGGSTANIRLIDVSSGSFTTTFQDIPLPNEFLLTGSFTPSYQQIEFLGDTLLLSVWNYKEAAILQYSIPSGTWSTLARFPNTNALYMGVVAGNVFVLSATDTASINQPNSVDMYLVTGGNVQHISPVQVQGVGGLSSFITGEGFPIAYGPYAVFPIYYFDGASTHAAVFAYDVLQGRLFKLDDIGGFDQLLGNVHGPRMALLNSMNHAFAGGNNLAAQWGVALPVLSQDGGTADVTNVQRLLFGCSNGGFHPFQQSGTQIVSSLIDFTSAQLKLFRQLVVTWAQPGLPNESDITVTVDVWLDQDPASLNAVPDFTGTVIGGAATQGQTQFKLRINQIAHKLVYRVTTTSGVSGSNMTSAVKLQTVVIRAATGWTRTMMLDLADNVMTNGKAPGVTAWSAQQPPGQPQVDAMVARDFLRQLWRLEGGECVAVFPGFDPPANWLLQDLHWDSPKPFGSSVRGDQRSKLEYLCQVKMREDV